MYGKIFDSMYEGTLYGHWEAIVTLQQMIVLCTPDGVVDMTPQAIAARTSIPLEIITKGLKVLSEPDPFTRTPGEEGRRLILIDGHRPWGWQIVNHEKYKNMRDAETVRAQTRERVRKFRENKALDDVKRQVTPGNASKRYAYSDSDASTDANSNADAKKKKGQMPADANAPATESGIETWEAYATAFKARYSVNPVRNAKVNGQIAALVKRLGAEEAPRVAEFYLTHNAQAYVQRGHSVGMLLIDAEKLRTEWARGRKITKSEVKNAEQADDAREQVERVAARIEARQVAKP